MIHKLLALAVLAGLASGQSFNSGSTGADGPLTYTTPGTVIFDPAVLGLNPAGDNVFNFTTINIGPGVTLKLLNGPLRNKPVVWLASGAVTIAGTIDLSGQAGSAINDPVRADRRPADPGPGGYPGGVGGGFGSNPQGGFGPGAGPAACGGIAYGCGGSYGTGAGCYCGGGFTYGNVVLVPFLGGSGGGGSLLFNGSTSSNGGGGGGGALRIESSVSITLTGSIAANGGDGGSGGPADPYTGGGGSGGAIHLISFTIIGAGSLSARGGGGTASGGFGRIRVDAFTQSFTGTSNPTPTLGPPYAVPVPTARPMVRVTSIGGIVVPPNPTGSFVTPDVVLNNPNPVTVNIQASNVPLGTQATLYLFSEVSTDVVLKSTALAGTLSNSTATVQVTFQPGYTTGFVRATF